MRRTRSCPTCTQAAATDKPRSIQGGTVVLATFASRHRRRQRRADAQQRDERIRAGYGHGVAHRLGADLPDEALLCVVGTGTPPGSCSSAISLARWAPATTSRSQFWDREEQTPGGAPGGFSPPPPGSPNPALCWEANIVTWNNSNLFSSTNSVNIATPYQDGWGILGLVGGATAPIHQLVSTRQPDVQRSAGCRVRHQHVLQRRDPAGQWRHDPVGVWRKLQAPDHDAHPIRRPVERNAKGGIHSRPFFWHRPAPAAGALPVRLLAAGEPCCESSSPLGRTVPMQGVFGRLHGSERL